MRESSANDLQGMMSRCCCPAYQFSCPISCPRSAPPEIQHTEVVVIGNGPAALALSAFLSGISPRYNPQRPHYNRTVHERLSAGKDQSLLEQEFSWIESCEEWNSRPLSSLYDSLVRPGADLGNQDAKSSLDYDFHPENAIPHVVLGSNAIGGSWNEYAPEMKAVSVGSWLDLPGYGVNEWAATDQGFEDVLNTQPELLGLLLKFTNRRAFAQEIAKRRLTSQQIAAYMRQYAEDTGIEEHFKAYVEVTSVNKCGDLWHVIGKNRRGVELHYSARHVVLACGKTKPRRLEVPGESESTNIVYDVWGLQKRLQALHEADELEATVSSSSPETNYRIRLQQSGIVVVGDGVSAADVVLLALNQGIPVTQVIKRTERQLRGTTMSRLSAAQYPEYNRVYRLMTGAEEHPLYRRLVNCSVASLSEVTLEITHPQRGTILEKYGLLAVCIGRLANVNGLVEGASVPIGQYTSDDDPTLHSVGALAGDHFVRFLVGGSLLVARDILKDHRERCSADRNGEIKPTTATVIPPASVSGPTTSVEEEDLIEEFSNDEFNSMYPDVSMDLISGFGGELANPEILSLF